MLVRELLTQDQESSSFRREKNACSNRFSLYYDPIFFLYTSIPVFMYQIFRSCYLARLALELSLGPKSETEGPAP